MANFVCTKCGELKEARCKPRKCPKCGENSSFEKQQAKEDDNEGKKSDKKRIGC